MENFVRYKLEGGKVTMKAHTLSHKSDQINKRNKTTGETCATNTPVILNSFLSMKTPTITLKFDYQSSGKIHTNLQSTKSKEQGLSSSAPVVLNSLISKNAQSFRKNFNFQSNANPYRKKQNNSPVSSDISSTSHNFNRLSDGKGGTGSQQIEKEEEQGSFHKGGTGSQQIKKGKEQASFQSQLVILDNPSTSKILDPPLAECLEPIDESKQPSNTTSLLQPSSEETFNCQENTLENYTCNACEFTTNLRIALHYHVKKTHTTYLSERMALDHKMEKFCCQGCSFSTYSALMWLKHDIDCSESITFEGNYDKRTEKCPYCLYVARPKNSKDPIICKHSIPEDTRWYKCNQCNYKGKLRRHLSKHTVVRHTFYAKIFFCCFCGYKALFENRLSRHILLCHSTLKAKCYECVWCSYKSTDKRSFQEHLFRHSSKGSLHCNICQFKTKHKLCLTNHVLSKHTAPGDITLLKCDYCDYKTKGKYSLQDHVNLKHVKEGNVKWYKCHMCPYITPKKVNLNAHVHCQHPNKDKLYKCNHCEHTTQSKRSLKVHIYNKHTSEEKVKWFNCEHCSYKTKHSYALKEHIFARHTALKNKLWLKCDYCGYLTDKRYSLKLHCKIVHRDKVLKENEKWKKLHTCNKCDYVSLRLATLNQHVRNKHTPIEKIKWFKCEFCDFSSKYKHGLQQHSLMHSAPENRLWFKCGHCEFITLQKSYMKHHYARNHGDKINSLFS